jgi:hypothetical protein
VSGFYVWGAQLEAGDFATSYIPTTSGSATRAADDVKTANISWLTAGTGVLYEEALSFAASSGGVGVFSLNNASTNNRIDMRTDAESIITAGGVSQAELDMAGGSVANVSSKYAIAYATNDFAGCFNGGTVATDGSGTPPTTITQFQFGALDGGTSNLLNGNIQRLTYWNTRLADIHLQAITA